MLKKTIKVSEKTHEKLFELKNNYNYSTIEDLLTHLIEINKKYENARTIKVIE